jgi:four helix bundle protein
MKITRFEDLECWQEARKLVNMVYEASRENKSLHNDFRLVNQLTGAAISAMGNISEGFVRRSNREFIQFLFISISSAAELQSHMYVAMDQHFVSKETFDNIYQQAEKIAKMISGLITYLRFNENKYKQEKQEKQEKLKKSYKPDELN